MPIYGITDRPLKNMSDGLPIIADGFKGTERTPEDIAKKRPGKELPHFRIKFRPAFAHLQSAWDEMYGQNPVELSGALITTDDVNVAFPTFNRVWAKTGIMLECDGKTITRQYVPELGRSVQANAQCLHEQGQTCECKREGTLKLIFPAFSALTGVMGVMRFTTHSFEDIVSIYRSLGATKIIYGQLNKIPFTLYREQGETSFYDQKEKIRKKMKKWFMKIRVNDSYLKATLEHRLGNGERVPTLQLPTGLVNDVYEVESDTTEYYEPEPEITWIATNGNMQKILTWAEGWFKMSPSDILAAFRMDDLNCNNLEDYTGEAVRIRACVLAYHANGVVSKIFEYCANAECTPKAIANDVKRLAQQFTDVWEPGHADIEDELPDENLLPTEAE